MTEVDVSKKLQVLSELYKEQCAHGRHTETQRQAVSSIFITFFGVFISVIGARNFALSTLPLALCIVALGYYAQQFLKVYEQRWDELSHRRTHYRREMQVLTGVSSIKEGVKKPRPRLRNYWRMTFLVMSIIGAMLSAIILFVNQNELLECSFLGVKRASAEETTSLQWLQRAESGRFAAFEGRSLHDLRSLPDS